MTSLIGILTQKKKKCFGIFYFKLLINRVYFLKSNNPMDLLLILFYIKSSTFFLIFHWTFFFNKFYQQIIFFLMFANRTIEFNLKFWKLILKFVLFSNIHLMILKLLPCFFIEFPIYKLLNYFIHQFHH